MESYKTAHIRTPLSTTEQTLHRNLIFTALVDQNSLEIVANATKKIVQSCIKSAKLAQTNLFKQTNNFLSYKKNKKKNKGCLFPHLSPPNKTHFHVHTKNNKNKEAQININILWFIV